MDEKILTTINEVKLRKYSEEELDELMENLQLTGEGFDDELKRIINGNYCWLRVDPLEDSTEGNLESVLTLKILLREY